jgi:hypothetical protein
VERLYSNIALGLPIVAATQRARQTLHDSFDVPRIWASPVVYINSQAEEIRVSPSLLIKGLFKPKVMPVPNAVRDYLSLDKIIRDATRTLGFEEVTEVAGCGFDLVLRHRRTGYYVGISCDFDVQNDTAERVNQNLNVLRGKVGNQQVIGAFVHLAVPIVIYLPLNIAPPGFPSEAELARCFRQHLAGTLRTFEIHFGGY